MASGPPWSYSCHQVPVWNISQITKPSLLSTRLLLLVVVCINKTLINNWQQLRWQLKRNPLKLGISGLAQCLRPNINVGPTVAKYFCPPMEKRIWTNLSAFPWSCPEIRTLLYNLAFLLFHILLQAVLKADWMLLIHITYYSKRSNILQL